jgi:hypothetical protein
MLPWFFIIVLCLYILVKTTENYEIILEDPGDGKLYYVSLDNSGKIISRREYKD